MPIWKYDTISSPVGTVDIGLIKDDSNVEALRRGPKVEMHPLSEKLVYTVEFAPGADPATSEPIDTTTADSTHVASPSHS